MTQPVTIDPFRAIADPTRRMLLERLARGEQRVGDLASGCDMTLAGVSQHLQVLRRSRLVSERRVGRERRYRLEGAPLREVADWLAFFSSFWESKLSSLEDHLHRRERLKKEK